MAHVDGVDFYLCPTGDPGDGDVQFTTDLYEESYQLHTCSSTIFGLFSFVVVAHCMYAPREFLDSFSFW